MEKTMTMDRVLCAALTVMLMLALVPTYAFAIEKDSYNTAIDTCGCNLILKSKAIYDSSSSTAVISGYLYNPTNQEYECCFNADTGGIFANGEIEDGEERVPLQLNFDCPTLNTVQPGETIPFEVSKQIDAETFERLEGYVIVVDVYLPENDEYYGSGLVSFRQPFVVVSDLEEANDNDNSTIAIEAEASTINVTVPTNAAFVFKSDGTNVYPSNYEITNNNGLTAITLDTIDFEGVNGWSLTTEDDVFQADVKKFALWMGARGNELSAVDVNDGVTFADDTEIKIAPDSSKVLGFEAKRGVFSAPVTTENAMQMTMHFDWEHAA